MIEKLGEKNPEVGTIFKSNHWYYVTVIWLQSFYKSMILEICVKIEAVNWHTLVTNIWYLSDFPLGLTLLGGSITSFKELIMRKVIGLLLFAIVPTLMFSEVVFMPRIGLDVYKGIKSEALDNMMVKWVNKALQNGKDSDESVTEFKNEDLPHNFN